MRVLTTLLCLTGLLSFAAADVTVLRMDDAAGFRVDAPIEPLTIEDKDGRAALHMRLPCSGKGVTAIRYTFPELQDWRGYDTLVWEMMASTTGEKSHIQMQLFDANNNEVMTRRDLPASRLNQWVPVSWNFAGAKPKKDPLDLSRIKMVFLSAWQDFYGHEAGHVVDYWFAPVSRQRSYEPTTLAVAPTTAPPVIDGQLADACWTTTPVAQQFFLRKGEGLPRETSEVRLLWDETNLYLAVQCFAEILDPVMQRTDEFVAKVTEHDGPVFRDDCMEIFLGPADDPGEYRQLVTNAIGGRYEGKGTDGTWDAPWEAAGSTSEAGYWIAEVAVPWTSLGITPAAGTELVANFNRTNKAQGEVSMWSPVTFAFHAPDEFGRLVLLGAAPPVVVEAGTIPPLMMGENLITPVMRAVADGRVLVRSKISQGNRSAVGAWELDMPAGSSAPVEVSVDLETPGEVSVVYSVIDADTDALYYQSPVCTFATAAVAAAEIETSGPCEVFLNGASLGKGGGAVEGYLEPGANVLAIMADQPVAVSVSAGGLMLSGARGWRQGSAVEGWMTSGFDDSAWPIAAETDGKLDARTGVCFRRVLAAGVTHFGQLGDADDIHIVAGGAQHLPLVVASPLERPLKNAKLVIETPPDLELMDWTDKVPYEWTGTYQGYGASIVERDGTQWRRHELAWEELQPVSYRGEAHASYTDERIHTLGFVVRAGDIAPGEKHLRLWVEGEDGAVVELPRDVTLTVLPALAGKRPEQIEFLMCHGFGVGNYSGEEMGALLDVMSAAGVNAFVERTHAREVYYPMLAERGMKNVSESLHYHWSRGLDLAGNKFVDFDATHKGSRYTFACPLWIIGEGREAVTDKLAEYIAGAPSPPDALWWDMEFGPKSTCFCPRCLAQFAEEHGIAGELTAQLVMDKYESKWVDTWCKRWAELSAVYREGMRKAVPDGQLYTYSAYQTERARGQYCIDWTLMREGCDVASAGYGWNDQIMADTLAALDGTPLLGGVGYYKPPRQVNLKVEYLKLLLAGCKGIMHYQWGPLDGLDYTRISEAASLVADHEAFFTEGQRADELVQGVPAASMAALQVGDRVLVVITNASSADATHTVSVPTARGATEYYTGQAYANMTQIQVTVPAHDARALILELAN